jgi:transposase
MDGTTDPAQGKGKGKPRIAEPQRRQGVIRFEMPEDMLEPTHPARVLWNVVGTLDLSAFLDGIKAVEGGPGRSTLSPQMKLVLWLYAISTGVGSAREIARLVETDAAYRWIVGDCEVSHQTVSKFRVEHGDALDELMTDILAALIHKGVLSLDLVAQDGMRVRASASAPSFRRHESLLACREQAALHLKAVLAQADAPQGRARPGRCSRTDARTAGRARSGGARLPAARRGSHHHGDGVEAVAPLVRPAAAWLDDRCHRTRDEDGRRWVSPGLQRPHGDRRLAARRSPHDRRRAGHERRPRYGVDHADAGRDRTAYGPAPEHVTC